ncbi:PEP-CTERM sorting domain-containing protein [Tautonia rosea]|uniref:PEP-CTERM sorting domain-containing protein n=1 Tax=Tautonia rosea TaxID=2728037 RepID=UPI00147598D0|nr:PEP-CTERM sorting domain-containing protein [Tautonia rosea]
MSHRLLGLLAMLGVVIAATGRPATASPTQPMTFRLTNTTASPVSEMYFELVPRDTIIPPVIGTDETGAVIEGSPMTALSSSTGIDVSTSYVLLTSDPSDEDMERMFLLFGYEPETDPSAAVPFRPLVDADGNRIGQLEPGGMFDFELNLAQDAVGWLLKSAVDGLSLSVLDLPSPEPEPEPTEPGGPDLGVGGTPIPEPSAVILWTAFGLGAFGFARRRRLVAAAKV